MATRRKTKPKVETIKIRLEVVDVNESANTVFLEGTSGDLKYALMIDAELNQKMTAEAVPGDKWDITLKNAIKLTRKVTKGKTLVGQVKGSVCSGSGAPVKSSDTFLVASGTWGRTTKAKCPDCGKDLAVTGGYGSKPMVMRKHNV